MLEAVEAASEAVEAPSEEETKEEEEEEEAEAVSKGLTAAPVGLGPTSENDSRDP